MPEITTKFEIIKKSLPSSTGCGCYSI